MRAVCFSCYFFTVNLSLRGGVGVNGPFSGNDDDFACSVI